MDKDRGKPIFIVCSSSVQHRLSACFFVDEFCQRKKIGKEATINGLIRKNWWGVIIKEG
jgi:hypothetical protein